jgi:hypothetical protein
MADRDHAEEDNARVSAEHATAQLVRPHQNSATKRSSITSTGADKESKRPGDRSIDQLYIDTIRTLSMDAVQEAEFGHHATTTTLVPVVYPLIAMRTHIRDRTHAATCRGFGLHFQDSTGQAHMGGPNSGVFLQITCDDPVDIDVLGHSYSFGVAKAAQVSGDLDVLVERGRRALRVHLKDVAAGLAESARAIDMALE